MKYKYDELKIEIIIFEHEDIITTSGGPDWNDPNANQPIIPGQP